MTDKKKESAKVNKAEQELKEAKDELEILKEAKPLSSRFDELKEYSEKEDEPFSSSFVEPNDWHKSEKGGCVIL